MAVCNHCNQEMKEADGCSDAAVVIEGREFKPVRWGRERWCRGTRDRCGDCHVRPGQVHHHGCDVEVCPKSGGQSISCGCLWAGEVDEETELDDDFSGEEFLEILRQYDWGRAYIRAMFSNRV